MARAPARRKGAKPSETSIHMAVEAFLRHAWPEHLPYTHFPAGERRDARTGGKLKRMGLKPGWPDFIFVMPNGQLAGLELKRADGELSDEQIELRARLTACRCGYATARSVDDVERILAGWLALFGLTLKASTVRRAA